MGTNSPGVPASDEALRRAEAHNVLGTAMAGRGDFPGAIAEFREAVRLVPDSAQARTNLGNALSKAGAADGDVARLDEAIEQQRAAARLRPGDARIRRNLGLALARRYRLDEAIEEYRAAIRLDPRSIAARADLGTALAALGRYPEALSAFDDALRLNPDNLDARFGRGEVRMALGDYLGAWPDMEARYDGPEVRARRIPGVPTWRGEELAGSLLINGPMEGFGDLIQALRFVPAARRRVGSVVVLCQPGIERLAARAPGVDRVATDRAQLPPMAAQVAPMSLPAIFGVTAASMKGDQPYLSADPAVIERVRPALAAIPGLKVGIAWQGNPGHTNDAYRSFPIAAMAPLGAIPGVEWIVLQKGRGIEQLAGAPFPVRSTGPNDPGVDWLDTANAVALLDLVIGPDSALVHLAGALGKPAWLALPTPADWRWGGAGEASPWYRSVRLFRQSTPGDWRPVFERMAEALAHLGTPPRRL